MAPRKVRIPDAYNDLFARETDGEATIEELAAISDFWASWTDEEIDAWEGEQEIIQAALETHYEAS